MCLIVGPYLQLAEDESHQVEDKQRFVSRARRALDTMLAEVAKAQLEESKVARVLCVSHGLTLRGVFSELLFQGSQQHTSHRWIACDILNCR